MAARRLSFQFVKNVAHSGRKGPDKHFDEHGLILRVRASGSKHWAWARSLTFRSERPARGHSSIGGWRKRVKTPLPCMRQRERLR